jgi:hypothetical protein
VIEKRQAGPGKIQFPGNTAVGPLFDSFRNGAGKEDGRQKEQDKHIGHGNPRNL